MNAPAGPPPLRPIGLVLHRDASWTHEGVPVLHRRLRAAFDRSVRYLPEEEKYVVQLGRFRGEIEIEEVGFFVRSFDATSGEIVLSDGSCELLRSETLSTSETDGALVCCVKHELAEGGLPARFTHAAQAALFAAVVEGSDGRPALPLPGALHPLPEL